MDMCVRDAGYGHVGEEKIMVADDVAVITESVDDLQKVANIWYQAADGNGTKINAKLGKTEVIMISRRQEECNVYLSNMKLNHR